MRRAILLADDNDDDVFFFKAAAKRADWKHEILVARNGRDVTDLLKRLAAGDISVPRFGLMLLDLKMPFIGGLEVLEWVRTRPELRCLPIVVLTSSEQESDIEAAYRLGAASYIVKPPPPEGMGALLRVIEAYWLRCNRVPAVRVDRGVGRRPAIAM